MSSLRLVEVAEDDFQVWLGSDDDPDAICIGVGSTREQAIDDAVTDLGGCVNQLAGMGLRRTRVTEGL